MKRDPINTVHERVLQFARALPGQLEKRRQGQRDITQGVTRKIKESTRCRRSN
jgi:hypothetical protein